MISNQEIQRIVDSITEGLEAIANKLQRTRYQRKQSSKE